MVAGLARARSPALSRRPAGGVASVGTAPSHPERQRHGRTFGVAPQPGVIGQNGERRKETEERGLPGRVALARLRSVRSNRRHAHRFPTPQLTEALARCQASRHDPKRSLGLAHGPIARTYLAVRIERLDIGLLNMLATTARTPDTRDNQVQSPHGPHAPSSDLDAVSSCCTDVRCCRPSARTPSRSRLR